MKNNRETFYLKNTGTKVVADLCGTAHQKSIFIQTNCEMSRDEALNIIATIRKAIKVIDSNISDCEQCSDKEICPVYQGVDLNLPERQHLDHHNL